jgi:N-acetylglucosaminyldiphosphoundecaprenol N-acetyl-beta-D-mannosaminyltransferase
VTVDDDRLAIGAVPIDWIDIEGVLARVSVAAAAGLFFQISTVNLDFLVQAQRDPEVRSILEENALNIPDGAPVVWLGWIRGARGKRRVAGADLVPRLMEVAAREGLKVFFLGGEDGTAAEAAARLVGEHPELQICVYEPPRAALADMDDADILRRLEAARPQILLVAFGHPKQEKWIRRQREHLPLVAMGVGCSLDLIAGRQSRAPSWMQRAGLEWMYRVAHEPARLARRYAIDGLWFVAVILPAALYARVTDRRRVRGVR